jgi:hypothetical protein
MKSFFILGLAALTLGLAGCRSPGRALGDLHLGDTPEIVEAELGAPNRKEQRAGARTPETVWIYTKVLTRRKAATGWSEVLVPGVSDQNGKVIQQPVTREVYHQDERQDVHVVFRNGRVGDVEYFRN